MTVTIDALVFEDSPRLSGEDPEHIKLLAEAGHPLPPIMVHQPTMRVIDGVHRVQAAMLNGENEIEARLLDCDASTAFLLAVKANITHGLPLSQADRAAAAARIITCHPHWSDRAVAEVAGLSDKTVSRIRARARSSAGAPQSDTRLGKDGRVRPLDTGVQRLRVAAIFKERPDAGLREVARATGLSAATVRDVRQRIARGENPVPRRFRPAADPERAAPATVTRLPGPAGRRIQTRGICTDRRVLLEKLRNDPSIRFSESGRHTLRWLHHHTVDADGLEDMCRGLPDHWAQVVAELARGCATAWTMLAEQLEQRTY